MPNLIPFPYKMGKHAPKLHPRTLSFEKYLTDDARAGMLPDAPSRVFREYKIPENGWGMYGNDRVGCCTFAAKAHILMLVTAHTGRLFIPDPAEVMKGYSAVSGYDPATGANDNGCAMTDVFDYMVKVGLEDHKFLAWAAVDPKNPTRLRQGVYIFGATDTGFQVPASAMQQFQDGQPWSEVYDDGGNEGGHDVPYFGEGIRGYSCVTWAKNQKITNGFEARYTDEAYVAITADWLKNADGLAPNMLNLDALQKDLAAIAA